MSSGSYRVNALTLIESVLGLKPGKDVYKRQVITRALGSDPRTQPDLFELTAEAGDRLLLCSDGLSTMLEDDQIAKILASHSEPQRCAAQLVNEAVGRGG